MLCQTLQPIVSDCKILQQIEKNNKRLKGADPMLKTRREIFERVRTLWVEKVGVWCALDFEAWDRDHTMLTEFGWSFVRWIDGQQVEEQGHLIVKEYRHYTNTFVLNNREVGKSRCYCL
jgi:hypothetical protein